MPTKRPFSDLDKYRDLLEAGVTRTFDSIVSLYNRSGRVLDRTILEHELAKLYQELGKRAATALSSPEAVFGADDPEVRSLLTNILDIKARLASPRDAEKKEDENDKSS